MEPDCLRRLVSLTREEGFAEETDVDELVNTTLGDRAARAWLAESASECRRWIPLDAEGRPCAWPKVSP